MLESDRQRMESIMASIGEDEDFGRWIRMEIEDRFGWSLAYFDEFELRSRFASEHGHDAGDDVPDDLWSEVWPVLRDWHFWREAEWLDDFVGDRISIWLGYEKNESFDSGMKERIAVWEVA